MTPLNGKRAHAMNDWTDKINVKDGNNVHGMEKDGRTEEAESPKSRHLEKRKTSLKSRAFHGP